MAANSKFAGRGSLGNVHRRSPRLEEGLANLSGLRAFFRFDAHAELFP